ncbi:MAG: sulfite exporter TauE/SafE family protein [Cytophagales bacterium]|nr:sulfite exporter TauE/SafE family protein [Cytophagales bacterium]MDW8384938.1 sulfite exporter TauE/SafE family protein [Flammeovirgaceae bacterium]
MGIEKLIILFISSYAAATISGAAGFGGALVLLPILTYFIDVKTVVPILTIGQLFGNASRVWLGRKELAREPIFLFLLTAIPCAIVGSYLLVDIQVRFIKVGIGIFLWALVLYRRLYSQKSISSPGMLIMLIGGGITGFLSGIAGSAGPIGAAFFLSLPLSPTAYVASEAFTAFVIHVMKIVVYQKYLLIRAEELSYGVFIGLAMIGGSWTGKRIIEKISKKNFTTLVEILLVVSGIQMVLTA